jgi:hypothetical protein
VGEAVNSVVGREVEGGGYKVQGKSSAFQSCCVAMLSARDVEDVDLGIVLCFEAHKREVE